MLKRGISAGCHAFASVALATLGQIMGKAKQEESKIAMPGLGVDFFKVVEFFIGLPWICGLIWFVR